MTIGLALLCLPLLAGTADGDYEERIEAWGLSLHGREREPDPEGKRIAEILVASENIVAPDDPWPNLVNVLHVKTRQDVIRREVLMQEGEPYSTWLAAESERNLRKLLILAVVRVIPIKAPEPGTVGVLVVTKDLLSIRLNSQFTVVGSLLQYLRLRPSENNFLGRNKQLSLDFALRLDTVALGQGYRDPRLLGSRLFLSESAAVILNRHTGKAEGSRGQVGFGLPLYSLESEWGFDVEGNWEIQTARKYRGAQIWQLPHPDALDPTATVPFVYRSRALDAAALGTRSFGRTFKTNLSAGVGAYSRSYEAPTDTGLTEDQRTWLAATHLPVSEDVMYTTAIVEAFQAEYRVLKDMETFAVSEDYQLGYSTRAIVRWSTPALFSSKRFVQLAYAARYRLYLLDDLATLGFSAAARLVPGADRWVNRRLTAELVNFSPPIWIGRIALRALVDVTSHDREHRVISLGGGNGLRGLAADALAGPNLVLLNLEYRTRPWELRTLHLGGVLFWDMGSAFRRSPRMTHTIGVGVRALFPQFNKLPLRIDFGYVLNRDRPAWLNSLSASFGQVFDYRPSYLDRPLD